MKKDSKSVLAVKPARALSATDVVDRVLDKGIVIDWQVKRILVGGIELPVTMNARYVVASLDTYLDYAKPPESTRILERPDAWLSELTAPDQLSRLFLAAPAHHCQRH
jgi:Gas vesicle protein